MRTILIRTSSFTVPPTPALATRPLVSPILAVGLAAAPACALESPLGKLTILPTNARGNAAGQHCGRHVDRATGVGPWFEPLGVESEFVYAGVGKKDGY